MKIENKTKDVDNEDLAVLLIIFISTTDNFNKMIYLWLGFRWNPYMILAGFVLGFSFVYSFLGGYTYVSIL